MPPIDVVVFHWFVGDFAFWNLVVGDTIPVIENQADEAVSVYSSVNQGINCQQVGDTIGVVNCSCRADSQPTARIEVHD